MSAAGPTISQIKAQVAAIRQKVPDASVIGIQAPGRWTGQAEYEDDHRVFRVRQCDSPLAIRVALLEARESTDATVIVTGLTEQDLEEDIQLRLAKRRLHRIDSWQIVKSLFQAHAIDPRITHSGWIADELLRLMPEEGYAPAGGGFLDAERVWATLLRGYCGIESGRPDLIALLCWTLIPDASERWRQIGAEAQSAAVDWITQSAGPLADPVFKVLNGHGGADAVVLGLVFEVVYATGAKRKLERSIGKLEERYFGGAAPSDALRKRWAEASAEVLDAQVGDARQRERLLSRLDAVLDELGAASFSSLSDFSPAGFDGRMRTFAKALRVALESPESGELHAVKQAREALVGHRRSALEQRRVDRAAMAIRLLAWRMSEEAGSPCFASLAEATRFHVESCSFVDWARYALRAGDPVRELSDAYRNLLAQVASIRDDQALRFAELVRDWTESGSEAKGLVPVEHVIDQVLIPLAESQPVLFLVLDGMSYAAWRELETDLIEKNWRIITREKPEPIVGLATVPSVTQASRTSLLCGQLKVGVADDERKGFQSHTGLLRVSKRALPPILFHKASLTQSGQEALAPDVRDAISDSDRRVVAIVVNAIDDHLFKGDQLDVRWQRDQIVSLPAILHEAAIARRAVLIASDHGHILDYGTEGKRFDGEGGERWRSEGPEAGTGEVSVTGGRVLLATNKRVIGLCTESLRYGSKRNGYHGGLTPQEMVVPLSILVPDRDLSGPWVDLPLYRPPWWELETQAAEPAAGTVTEPEKFLFEMAKDTPADSAATESPWINALLKSPVLEQQKTIAGRAVPGDDDLAELLTTLSETGGRTTVAALARRLKRTNHRMNGLLAVCQRLLNVDGYQVLSRDDQADTVEFNQKLATTQFGLDE